MIDTILGLDRERLASSGTANPRQWLIDWVSGGSATASGEKINEETALTCAAVKASVSLLAETVAGLPVHVYERLADGRKRAAAEHPVENLLTYSPNPETSSFVWRETLQGHLGTWGNAYSEIEWSFNRKVPLALWQRLPKPERTKPMRRDSGELYYECHGAHGEVEADIPPDDMLHIPGFGFDGLMGYSPISQGKETIGLAKAAEKYPAQLFDRDCRPTGFVTLPGELSQPAYDRTKKGFNDPDTRHRVQMLEGGATFASAEMNPQDVQLIDARRLSVEDIARIYRIPLPLLQMYMSGMAYASVVELNRAFIVYTMRPWFRRWEGEINRKLLTPPYFAEFKYEAFMQGDPKTQSESYRTAFSFGGFTINDFLRKQNENTIGPEGDRRFVPMNMIPLDRADDYVDAIIEGKKAKRGALAEEPSSAVLASARELLAEAIERMLVKECKAAKRAAKKPGQFLAWMEEFYDHHQDVFAEAVRPAVQLLLSLGMQVLGCECAGEAAEALAYRHIEESRQQLLRAMECQPDELEEKVGVCADAWEDRKYSNLEEFDATANATKE